ncbi:tetratricopeptide repeat protein [Shewanella psychromarinicola]|uniref:Tetratricopeptide repeat protein n=2 Tax=Shewanella psychromarinicola TaxID=2487742 RepID=A0A3N4E9H1_9GAMM|nr:tetratricopeptide repeat protein [Shewanella psychromarinicola]RPA34865.1 tetratricopeptide repeat protein [Shewanella psychromarinicola]
MSIKSNMARAEALFRQKEYAESLSLCTKIIEKKPKLANAIHLTALNYYALGQFAPAIAEFQKAIAINSQLSSFHSNLGNVYLDQESFVEASRCFEKALNLEPLLPEPNYNLAICLHNQRNYSLAENFCKKAILQDATNSDFYLHLGVIYYDQGQFDNAAKALVKALEVENKHKKGRTHLDAYWQLFSLHLSQHRYQDALEVADLGIQSQQLSEQQLCTLLIGKAIIYFLFNHLDEAKHTLQLSEIIHQFPSQPKYLKNFSVFHHYIKNLIALYESGEYKDCYNLVNDATKMYFISESHGFAPNRTSIQYKDQNYEVNSLFIMGAKVIHFVTEEENKYQVSLVSLLQDLAPGSKVVVAFGEIDCRPDEGIYSYSLKSKRDYKDVIDDMLSKYVNALKNLADSFDIEIILYGVPAPHPQSIEILPPSEQQRFKDIVAYYNLALANACQSLNIKLLDVYALTNKDGQSNLQHHIDNYHLSPKTVPTLFNLQSQ